MTRDLRFDAKSCSDTPRLFEFEWHAQPVVPGNELVVLLVRLLGDVVPYERVAQRLAVVANPPAPLALRTAQ